MKTGTRSPLTGLVKVLPMADRIYAGVYSIGLYDSLDDTESDVLFPLPVLKRNPLLQTQI